MLCMDRTRRYFRPIKDETIISALVYLRDITIRDELDGLEHVDALLRLRGHDPESQPTPRKTPKNFKRGELRRAVLDKLRTGPKTGRQMAELVHADYPALSYKQVYKRVFICLWTLNSKGRVRRRRNEAGNLVWKPKTKNLSEARHS